MSRRVYFSKRSPMKIGERFAMLSSDRLVDEARPSDFPVIRVIIEIVNCAPSISSPRKSPNSRSSAASSKTPANTRNFRDGLRRRNRRAQKFQKPMTAEEIHRDLDDHLRRHRRARKFQKPPTAEELDRDLDDYFRQDPSRYVAKLDNDLEKYMAQPRHRSPAKVSRVDETDDE